MGADALNREEKISVIVPVYRVEAYLPRCLDSILAQSYSNLEVILVDDGSPDQSGEICDEYARRDKRIRVIHQINQGVSAARNAGLAVATGEWIGFVDGDDWIDPEMYEYLHELVSKYHSSFAQCGFFLEYPSESKKVYTADSVICIKLKEHSCLQLLYKYFSYSSWCKLFRRSDIFRLQFDLKYPIEEDLLFNLNFLSQCGEIVIGSKAGYHYYQNINGACYNTVKENQIICMRKMFQYAEKQFANQFVIANFCYNGKLRNNLDICSKIVCNHLESLQKPLIVEIKDEMRKLCHERFAGTDFNKKEQLKSFLIGYLWEFYRWGLPKWKQLQGSLTNI